ncbi:hypothetical protein RSAG8_00162, partial [Rhizoctonia solani AG-8 WAC10335]
MNSSLERSRLVLTTSGSASGTLNCKKSQVIVRWACSLESSQI